MGVSMPTFSSTSKCYTSLLSSDNVFAWSSIVNMFRIYLLSTALKFSLIVLSHALQAKRWAFLNHLFNLYYILVLHLF